MNTKSGGKRVIFLMYRWSKTTEQQRNQQDFVYTHSIEVRFDFIVNKKDSRSVNRDFALLNTFKTSSFHGKVKCCE